MTSKQIKAKDRVRDHGEVYTNDREVNAMLDMVKQESERIDSRFLEPACGNGNFLAVILDRKLSVVKKKYKKNQSEYEKYSFVAMTSIYGIDLLEDNVIECQERMLSIFLKEYAAIYKGAIQIEVIDAMRYVLSKNILCGNALDMKHSDGTSLVVAEWSMMGGGMVKRRDFIYEELLREPDQCKPIAEENLSIFDLGKEIKKLPASVFIPKPIKEYPLVHYRRIKENELYNSES